MFLRLAVVVGLGILAVPLWAGEAALPPSSKAVIAELERSTVLLTEQEEGCRSFAPYFATLGELVAHYAKVANRERTAKCAAAKDGDAYSCSATFSNRPEHSEDEFTLTLDFRLHRHRISALKCFLAG